MMCGLNLGNYLNIGCLIDFLKFKNASDHMFYWPFKSDKSDSSGEGLSG